MKTFRTSFSTGKSAINEGEVVENILSLFKSKIIFN